jgi:hypothetical protein
VPRLCIECDALLSEYLGATERHAVLVGALVKAVVREASQYPEFQKLKQETAEARLKCNRARKTLTAHRESQVCSRYGISQTSPQPCASCLFLQPDTACETVSRIERPEQEAVRGHS